MQRDKTRRVSAAAVLIKDKFVQRDKTRRVSAAAVLIKDDLLNISLPERYICAKGQDTQSVRRRRVNKR